VVQEGLRNVASHAGVREASVAVTQSPDGVALTIVDSGRGFEQDGAASRRGLGLLSIEERVRLIDGTFNVTSTPGRGTAIYVHVPGRALDLPA
jgi:signal transduction histidine kinase